MAFDDVYLVNKRLNTSTQEGVKGAEANLKLRFPDGYAEFVTKFGEGTFSNFVRVYKPERIVEEHRDFQERWDEYFLWDEGVNALSKEQVIESIIVADTLQGDELIFHPSNPDRLLILPRYTYTVLEAGADLPTAIDWMCQSGTLTAPIRFKYFESFENRKRIIFVGEANFDAVCDELTSLNVHAHLVLEKDEEDPFFEMFVPDFQGSVGATADDGEVTSWLTHDTDSATDTLKKTIQCLESLGLIAQAEDEDEVEDD